MTGMTQIEATNRDTRPAWSLEHLTATLATALSDAGLPDADAHAVAANLADADLRGVHSHGAGRLRIYLDRLQAGGNAPTGTVRVLVDAPALALLDAGRVLSQVAAARAVEIAADKAAAVGCAAVVVRRASHFGTAGYWARMLAEQGLIGVATTNTSPLMTAWGGADTAIGTNPLAFAFPSATGAPVVVDVATSETTWGALLNAQGHGAAIPDTWALGRDGTPTTDAAEAVRERRMLPFGRHKGYALAVAVELLAGALAGARCLSAIPDMYAQPELPMDVGHTFLALDPRMLEVAAEPVAERVATIQAELEGHPPAPGVERVMWPGQPEEERAREARVEGIRLPPTIELELRALTGATPDR
jgi:LDH2 family malate/lactate/ureidoglycolate dehydrogenase